LHTGDWWPDRRGRLRLGRGGRRGRPGCEARLREVAHVLALAPHRDLLPHPRARPRPPRPPRAPPDARARQGLLRRQWRGCAPARGDRDAALTLRPWPKERIAGGEPEA